MDRLSAKRAGRLTDNNPRSLGAVYGSQISLEPVQLSIHRLAEWAGVLGTVCASNLVGASTTFANVGFGVNDDEVSHALVVRVPEVAGAIGLRARHTEVVDVAGEVGLAREADGDRVGDVVDLVRCATVVACEDDELVYDTLPRASKREATSYSQLRGFRGKPCMAH